MHPSLHLLRAGASAVLLVLACAATSCVTENLTTGKVVPRGDQKLPFDEVQKASENLKVGMNKMQVLMLLGSPAEKDASSDVWIYLPERYAILIPARALRLAFANGALAEYGYRPIVLGTQL